MFTNQLKEDYENIASKYWPGALTIVIPSSEMHNVILTSKDLTLGLRIPNSHMAQSLIKETGPLLTSSANISGITGSNTAEGVALDFPSLRILGPIPWEKSSGKASTIISWKKSGEWRLIRKGEVLVGNCINVFIIIFCFINSIFLLIGYLNLLHLF